MEAMDCNNMDEMRLMSASHLVKTAVKINGLGHNLFRPTVDGAFLSEATVKWPLTSPDWGCPVPCLVGLNADEGAFLTAGLLATTDRSLDLVGRTLLLDDKSEANEVRQHYFGQAATAINWENADHLTKAISDGLFGHPLQLLLRHTVVQGLSSDLVK